MINEFIKFLFSPMTYGKPGGFYVQGPFIMVMPSLLAIAFLFIWSLVWVYRNAAKRNRNGVVAILFILLTGWPGSFIWWCWLRPPPAEKALADRKLRQDWTTARSGAS